MNDLLLCLVIHAIHACILPIFLQDVFQYRFMLVIFGKQLVILSVQLISLNHDWHLQSECRCAIGWLTPAAPRHLASNVLIEHLFGGGEPPILWPTMTVTMIHYDQSMINYWNVTECDCWQVWGEYAQSRNYTTVAQRGRWSREGKLPKDLLRRITLTVYVCCASKAALLSSAVPLQKVIISWSCYAEDFVYKTPMGLLIICIDARLQEGNDLTNIERLNKDWTASCLGHLAHLLLQDVGIFALYLRNLCNSWRAETLASKLQCSWEKEEKQTKITMI